MYEEIVPQNRDPALLEWIGTGMFRTNVFPVPAGASRTVSLRYSQLCRKEHGLTDFLFPMSTAKYTSQAVEKVEIRATIESQEEIKNVYSPSHAVEIKRPDEQHATITLQQPRNEVPIGDFRLFYDVGRGKVSTRVLSYRPDTERGRLFPAAGQSRDQAGRRRAGRPRRSMFVIDRSGSMSGKKIEQVKGGPEVRAQQPPPRRSVQHRGLRRPGGELPARVAAIQRRNAQGRHGFCRRALCRRQHRYRRRAANAPSANCKDAKRPNYIISSPTACPPPARPTKRRSWPTPRNEQGSGAAVQPSAWATTSTAGCWTGWCARTSARANTSGRTRTSKTTSAGCTAASSRP